MAIQQQTRSNEPKTFGEAADHRSGPVEQTPTANADVGGVETSGGKNRGRHLVIRVSEGGAARANVRIPLGLARAAGKFIPREEKARLKDKGIDIEEILGALTGDELGPLVQVEDDGKSVWIAVE